MKKFWMLTVVGMLLWATACASPAAEPATNSNAEVPTVALILKSRTTPFFSAMERGAKDAASELDINLIVSAPTLENSVQRQVALVEAAIEDAVDAIVIAPIDSKLLVPIIARAQNQGIVIVTVDTQLDPQVATDLQLSSAPFVSVNNEQGAYLAAKYVADQITQPTDAILLDGLPSAQTAIDRKSGALRAFAENENIAVVATEAANWLRDDGYRATAQLFAAFPDIEVIFAANEAMALGALDYLTENNIMDILIATYDVGAETREAIRAGNLAVAVDQQPALQGYTGVEMAVQLLNGADVDDIVLVDVMLVTTESLE